MFSRIYPSPRIPVSMPTIPEDNGLQALELYPKNGIGRIGDEKLLKHYKFNDPRVKPITLLSGEQIHRFGTERISALGIEAIESIFFQLTPSQVGSINPVVLRKMIYKLHPCHIHALNTDQLEVVVDLFSPTKIQYLSTAQISSVLPHLSRLQKSSLSAAQRSSLPFCQRLYYCL
ncbi:MAG: hypothetical protein NT065_03345 [Chlamydiae bacterium]|nr:hypothetical protein [Chlamydiota bacterium]